MNTVACAINEGGEEAGVLREVPSRIGGGGRGRELLEEGGGGGQPGTWPGLRDAKPKRGRKSGLRGDRAPSDVVLCKCRGRKIEGAERDPNSCLFFFFFLYQVLCLLSRYKDRMQR